MRKPDPRLPERLRAASLILLPAVIVSGVYILRLDTAAGLIVDDAWYVVLAKAIAQGDGYRLISSGVAPILPSVPPGFPLALSAVFAIDPDFPSNVFLLKLVSVVAMLGVGLFTWTHARRVRELSPALAGSLAAATVLTPAFVFLATSTVMAECAFTLAQLAAVWFLDRAVAGSGRPEGRPYVGTVVAGLATGAAILIRSAGVATVIGGLAFLLFRRRYSLAGVFLLVVALTYAPWWAYARANQPTLEERMAHGGAMAYSYVDLLSFREGGVEGSGRATAADVVARVRGNILSMIAKDFGGIAVPVLYRGASESGQEVVSMGAGRVLMAGSMGNAAGTLILSTVLSAIALLGFWLATRRGPAAAEFVVVLSVAMIALVPSWSFRYLLTLTPFLLYYLLAGLQRLARSNAAMPRMALLTIVGLHVLDHAQYIALARDPARIDWLGDAAEADALFAWMGANLESEGLIASTNPGLVFLRTGRKAVASDNPMENWREWKDKGVRYMVTLRTVDLPPKRLGYEVKYFSPRRKLWVIDVPPLQ